MKYKSEDQWPRIIECGPGTSLISMLRIMNGKMAKGAMVMSAWNRNKWYQHESNIFPFEDAVESQSLQFHF